MKRPPATAVERTIIPFSNAMPSALTTRSMATRTKSNAARETLVFPFTGTGLFFK